jgi:hypothetical protein
MAGKLNLFDLANANSGNLEGRWTSTRDQSQDGETLNRLEDFARYTKTNWRFSINMKEYALLSFLEMAEYVNVRGLKKVEEAELLELGVVPEISREEAEKRHLKGHAAKRAIFDSSFEKGEEFKWGALSVGGIGLTNYGQICVVIKREAAEQYSSLAFIKEDSEKYVENDQLDVEQLKGEISNKEFVHILAALKHVGDLKRIPKSDWCSMVCFSANEKENVNIDVVTTDRIFATHIETVCMRKDFVRRAYASFLEEQYLSRLRPEDRPQLYVMWAIFKRLKNLGIEIKRLD